MNLVHLIFGSKPRALGEDTAYTDTFRDEASAKARLCTYDAALARQQRRKRLHDKLADEIGHKRLRLVR